MKQEYPVHVSNITTLHNAQFSEYGSASTIVTIGGKEDILKAVGIRVKNAELINGGHTANFSIVERSIYHRKSFPQVRINSLWHYINDKVAFHSNLLKNTVLSFSIFAEKNTNLFFEILNLHFSVAQ